MSEFNFTLTKENFVKTLYCVDLTEFLHFIVSVKKSPKHSVVVDITEIYSHEFFGKNFVKVTILLKNRMRGFFIKFVAFTKFFTKK